MNFLQTCILIAVIIGALAVGLYWVSGGLRGIDLRKCDGDHGGKPCNDPECWQRPGPEPLTPCELKTVHALSNDERGALREFFGKIADNRPLDVKDVCAAWNVDPAMVVPEAVEKLGAQSVCPECGGEGKFNTSVYGGPREYHHDVQCENCDGFGVVWGKVPRT